MQDSIKIISRTSDKIYKEFFKVYYREKFKTASILMIIAAVILFVGALYSYYNLQNNIAAFFCVWIGIFMIVYPKLAYRKPYKAMKNKSITSHFVFDDEGISEKSGDKIYKCKYENIKKVIETHSLYVFIYNDENASVADKSFLTESDSQILRGYFKLKSKYKYVK